MQALRIAAAASSDYMEAMNAFSAAQNAFTNSEKTRHPGALTRYVKSNTDRPNPIMPNQQKGN